MGGEEETKREAERWHITPTGEKDQILIRLTNVAVSQYVFSYLCPPDNGVKDFQYCTFSLTQVYQPTTNTYLIDLTVEIAFTTAKIEKK